MKSFVRVVSGLVVSLALAAPAFAQYGMDHKQPQGTPDMPRCDRPLGTAAIREPDHDWWSPLGLSNPEALLKLFAGRSNCLRIVDRNGGLQMHNEEEALAQSGELRQQSNVGRGQVKAADYFIVPDLANSNSDSGGNSLAGVGGAFLPGGWGALAASVKTKRSEAQALVTLVDARTTEQLYVAEGNSQKTDVSFGGGGGGGGWGGWGALAGSSYSNTAIGKVVTAAYFNAFIDLIHYMQSNAAPEPGSASANAGIQAYRVQRPLALKFGPTPTAKTLRDFAPNDLVYPTGQRNGVWWEVDDENGNRGWVSSAGITPR